jgi:hypothetical protein
VAQEAQVSPCIRAACALILVHAVDDFERFLELFGEPFEGGNDFVVFCLAHVRLLLDGYYQLGDLLLDEPLEFVVPLCAIVRRFRKLLK